jgi:hypothetical protein
MLRAALATALLASAAWCATANPDSLVFGDDPRAPIEVDDALLCHACNAVILELYAQVCLGCNLAELAVQVCWCRFARARAPRPARVAPLPPYCAAASVMYEDTWVKASGVVARRSAARRGAVGGAGK